MSIAEIKWAFRRKKIEGRKYQSWGNSHGRTLLFNSEQDADINLIDTYNPSDEYHGIPVEWELVRVFAVHGAGSFPEEIEDE